MTQKKEKKTLMLIRGEELNEWKYVFLQNVTNSFPELGCSQFCSEIYAKNGPLFLLLSGRIHQSFGQV